MSLSVSIPPFFFNVIKNLKTNTGYPITFDFVFFRYDLDHPDFKRLTEMIDDFGRSFSGATLADMFPALAFIPTPMGRMVKKFTEKFFSFIKNELNEHKKNFDKGKK